MNEFLLFKLMKREGKLNLIHIGQKLGQQYLVDQYCKMEMARLKYIKNNQDLIRADFYRGSYDDIDQEDSEMSSSTRVVLPSTFTGGARYMHQKMLDSMVLVQKFGKPHFFITMT